MEKNPELNGLVFTVGNEQDYHFKVLFSIIKKLGFNWSSSLYHLSYGMVDLPSGKMKSREGTVVDADNLIDEMTKKAKSIAKSVGKIETLKNSERENLYNIIGLGALKYFILKVDPKKEYFSTLRHRLILTVIRVLLYNILMHASNLWLKIPKTSFYQIKQVLI